MAQTNIKKIYRQPGYVLEQQDLHRIDKLVRKVLGSLSRAHTPCEKEGAREAHYEIAFECTIMGNDGLRSKFDSLDSCLKYAEDNKFHAKALNVDYRQLRDGHTYDQLSKINLAFESNGVVSFIGYSEAPDFQFEVTRLLPELENLPSFGSDRARWLIKSPHVSTVLFLPMLCLIAVILGVGLDVASYSDIANNQLAYDASSYPREVVNALESDSVTEKLDVLLKEKLKRTSANKAMSSLTSFVRACLWVEGFLMAIAISRLLLRKLYPESIIVLTELQREALRKKEKLRDLVNWSLIGAFAVSIAAGILV